MARFFVSTDKGVAVGKGVKYNGCGSEVSEVVYLLLSILCSSVLAIGMRLSEGRIQSKMSMIATNYVACMIMGIGYMGIAHLIPTGDGVGPMLGMGVFNGTCYMVALVLNQYNISRNGVVLPSVFSKTGGLLIPLVVSILLFREFPSILQIIGFVLAMTAIIMISQKQGGSGASNISKGALFALFVGEGCAGIMAKVFRELGNPALGDHFLFVTFGVAFLLCAVVILAKGERPGKMELMFGTMIGIPNFMSAKFQLMALETLPAVIVYPMRSAGTIVVITLAGVLFFKERLTKLQLVAVGIILVSLILLNL